MFVIGDKVRVKETGAVGVVEEILDDPNQVCVEFDGCAATRTCYTLAELELIRPTSDMSADVEIVQADKGL
jgi:uncharacterized protein YodC (DUF2158 family)